MRGNRLPFPPTHPSSRRRSQGRGHLLYLFAPLVSASKARGGGIVFLSYLCVASQRLLLLLLLGWKWKFTGSSSGRGILDACCSIYKNSFLLLSSIQGGGGGGNLVSESMLRCWEEEEEEAEEDRGESRVSSSFQPFIQCMRRGKVFGSTFANNISG